MNMKTYLSILILITFIMGCTKDKPESGSYIGVFNGTYTQNNVEEEQQRYVDLELIKSTKDYIEFRESKSSSNYFKITKCKYDVNGIIDVSEINGATIAYVFGPITIDGKWSKNDNGYLIVGNFSYEYKIVDSNNQTTESFVVSGGFEIISN